jgi:hypothetical protein
MPHRKHSSTKRRNSYSKRIGKMGRTMKRKLYSYYKKLVKAVTRKGRKRGG